jgi:hypothetical protein
MCAGASPRGGRGGGLGVRGGIDKRGGKGGGIHVIYFHNEIIVSVQQGA